MGKYPASSSFPKAGEPGKLAPGSPEEQLLEAMFGGLTKEEAKHLSRLLKEVERGTVTVYEARTKFKSKFPDSKWIKG